MCGIVSYIGPKDPVPILLKGLRRLEYRGYDSAGVALLNKNNLQCLLNILTKQTNCLLWESPQEIRPSSLKSMRPGPYWLP